MKLFMFYIGGNCGNSNIELHDIRFSVGSAPEDCYDGLRRQWWGDPTSLHLDSWGIVEQADGFDVAVTRTPRNDTSSSLFFVNLGGYNPQEFGELHKNVLVVAPDIKAAKHKALQQVNDWVQPHKDRIFEIEKAVDLTALMENYGCALALEPATVEKPFAFQCLYLPLG
ncbi:DUF1543 domain-containing protein [Bradyrhizobium canariense]|uniref:DUF1543 domain-containing protein n=1 Tax=Bradyrhizobium canariense TaxID=255045 RepID=A0A1H1VZ68_9BRAD|nr:DUF1543 domain-containing protein [Bradyrhizobium canariense]SDS89741.1 protein of unknown function [Bradyrhizobium canariense]